MIFYLYSHLLPPLIWPTKWLTGSKPLGINLASASKMKRLPALLHKSNSLALPRHSCHGSPSPYRQTAVLTWSPSWMAWLLFLFTGWCPVISRLFTVLLSQVIPHSHAFLHCLINFSCSFSFHHVTHYIPAYIWAEIWWWHTYAFLWNGIHLIAPHHDSVHIFTDASGTKGLGGIFGAEWFSSHIPWCFHKCDIQFKELYAVLQAILRWGHKWQHKHVLSHIHNQVDVWVLENDINRSPHVMGVLHMIVMLTVQLKFSYSSSWLSSSANVLADCASCYMYNLLFSLAPYLHWQPTSTHPQTVGIRCMLMSQSLQHSGYGMVSLPTPTFHTWLGSIHSSTSSLPTCNVLHFTKVLTIHQENCN